MLKLLALISGPFVFSLILAAGIPAGISSESRIVLATALLMAFWWVTEAIPLYATSLVPLVAFPLGQVTPAAQVATAYMDNTIVLFMGGFFLAMSIQKCNLHRRIALAIIAFLGGSLSRMMLGFMAATAFLSMWVSNTATAIMMLPIAAAVVIQLQESGLPDRSNFPTVLMLSIAYSAGIGGMATLIGTPPNLVFAAQFQALFPDMGEINFGKWILFGLPFSAVFLAVTWFYLTRMLGSSGKDRLDAAREVISLQRRGLGALSHAEKAVSAVFVLTALAWIFRSDLVLGSFVLPGWASLAGVEEYVHDSTVAMFSTLLMFVIPAGWKE